MNACAGSINEAGIALVYLVNVVPSLTMKLNCPYWFHYVSCRCRMDIMAFLMVCYLGIVARGDGNHMNLLGASILAMTSFYVAQGKPTCLGLLCQHLWI